MCKAKQEDYHFQSFFKREKGKNFEYVVAKDVWSTFSPELVYKLIDVG